MVKKHVFKIIHISDTHVGPRLGDGNVLRFEALLGSLDREEFDHLVVSGDLTDNADAESLKVFRDILKSHGLWRSGTTTVVPGNHDIFGTVRSAADFFRFPRRFSSVDFPGALSRFADEMGELFDGAAFLLPGKIFPFAKNVGGATFVGVNSSLPFSRTTNLFASKGNLTAEDLSGIESWLKRNAILPGSKILVSHHDVWRKTPVDSADGPSLRALRKLGFGAVFHGHTHEMTGRYQEGVLLANAGAAVDNGSSDHFAFNEIEYDGCENHFHIVCRKGELAVRRPRRMFGGLAGRLEGGVGSGGLRRAFEEI